MPIFTKKPLQEFLQDGSFKKVEDFLEIKSEKLEMGGALKIVQKNTMAKDTSSNLSIAINTKSVLRIVKPTYTSYTFSINQLKQKDNSFRNLIVSVSENKTTAIIHDHA